MNEQDQQQRQAAEALATISAHQERTRRAARLPWWVYLAMFVLAAAGGIANDFVSLSGAKLIAGLILVVLAATLIVGLATGSAPLSLVRGVQPRQAFVPTVFVIVMVVGSVGAWLISRYGNGFTHNLADAVGLSHYPNTVTGVLYGVAFTALFALGQLLLTTFQRREHR